MISLLPHDQQSGTNTTGGCRSDGSSGDESGSTRFETEYEGVASKEGARVPLEGSFTSPPKIGSSKTDLEIGRKDEKTDVIIRGSSSESESVSGGSSRDGNVSSDSEDVLKSDILGSGEQSHWLGPLDADLKTMRQEQSRKTGNYGCVPVQNYPDESRGSGAGCACSDEKTGDGRSMQDIFSRIGSDSTVVNERRDGTMACVPVDAFFFCPGSDGLISGVATSGSTRSERLESDRGENPSLKVDDKSGGGQRNDKYDDIPQPVPSNDNSTSDIARNSASLHQRRITKSAHEEHCREEIETFDSGARTQNGVVLNMEQQTSKDVGSGIGAECQGDRSESEASAPNQELFELDDTQLPNPLDAEPPPLLATPRSERTETEARLQQRLLSDLRNVATGGLAVDFIANDSTCKEIFPSLSSPPPPLSGKHVVGRLATVVEQRLGLKETELPAPVPPSSLVPVADLPPGQITETSIALLMCGHTLDNDHGSSGSSSKEERSEQRGNVDRLQPGLTYSSMRMDKRLIDARDDVIRGDDFTRGDRQHQREGRIAIMLGNSSGEVVHIEQPNQQGILQVASNLPMNGESTELETKKNLPPKGNVGASIKGPFSESADDVSVKSQDSTRVLIEQRTRGIARKQKSVRRSPMPVECRDSTNRPVTRNGGDVDCAEVFSRFAEILSAYHNGRALTREVDCRSLPLASSNFTSAGLVGAGRRAGGLTTTEEEACLHWQWKLYAIYIRVIKVTSLLIDFRIHVFRIFSRYL